MSNFPRLGPLRGWTSGLHGFSEAKMKEQHRLQKLSWIRLDVYEAEGHLIPGLAR